MKKSARPKFEQRKFRASSRKIIDGAIALLQNLPVDPDRPLEIVVREEVRRRHLDQNAMMWAGPIADCTAQIFVEGRQYSPEVWHEQFKQSFLPEAFDPELTREGYIKWDFMPNGDRVLVGSTADLTVKGFAQYIEQIHAFGAEWGVKFHAPGEVPR